MTPAITKLFHQQLLISPFVAQLPALLTASAVELLLLLLAAHLAAELAEVLGVLADLHLLDLLTETRSIASSVLAHNANLLCALRLQEAGRQASSNSNSVSRDLKNTLQPFHVV